MTETTELIHLDTFEAYVSTKKGRDAIASMAYKVAKDKAGIEWFQLRAKEHRDLDASELRATLAEVDARAVDEAWQEYEAEAHRAKARALDALTAALAAREKQEAEQAELAKLRAEAAAREQKEREERIAREAAERAQREAEAKAQAEREATIKREADAQAAAERRELELKLQAERAEREKAEAIQREQQAKADAERQAAERRERDKAHKTAINRAALDAFVTGGMTEECAKLAVTLIAKKAIPAVFITY